MPSTWLVALYATEVIVGWINVGLGTQLMVRGYLRKTFNGSGSTSASRRLTGIGLALFCLGLPAMYIGAYGLADIWL